MTQNPVFASSPSPRLEAVVIVICLELLVYEYPNLREAVIAIRWFLAAYECLTF